MLFYKTEATVALSNIKRAFPDFSAKKMQGYRKELISRSSEPMLLNCFLCPSSTMDEVPKRFTVEAKELFEEALAKEKA